MRERTGVLIAIVSSSLGGTAAAVTRYLVNDADALTLAILRWDIGFLCVLPVALMLRVRWPQRRDWPAVAALGVAFFGLFFIFYNIAVSYTTAARASLAPSRFNSCAISPGPPLSYCCNADFHVEVARVKRRRPLRCTVAH